VLPGADGLPIVLCITAWDWQLICSAGQQHSIQQNESMCTDTATRRVLAYNNMVEDLAAAAAIAGKLTMLDKYIENVVSVRLKSNTTVSSSDSICVVSAAADPRSWRHAITHKPQC
jgi:hypothetical protein